MDSETSKRTNLNNNKENLDENQKDGNINDNSKIYESKSYSQYFTRKTLFILFIVLIFSIYLIQVLIFHKTKTKTEIPFKSFSSVNKEKLNKTEAIIAKLKPNPSYKGPIFPDDGKITKEWVFELIDYMKDLEWKKPYKEKYLDKLNLLKMISKAKSIFDKYDDSIININIPNNKNFTVVGDVHGQFYDLLNIFKINGYPSEDNPYLFNGDFVDRGVFSIETITTLMAFKILYPDHFFMNRGNHEDEEMNMRYGFESETIDKYDLEVFECFSEFYKFLPLGHVLNKKVLVLHGGLFSKEGVTLNELKKIDRFIEVPMTGLMCELLWSDPRDESGCRPSDRGAGVYFGPDVTEKFLNDNNLELLIRSHETKMEGYEIQHGGKLITLFSAPNYCDSMGNKGAIIKFRGGEMKPNIIQFDASFHPDNF